MKQFALFISIILATITCYSQGVKFNKAFGNNGFDYGRNVVQGANDLYYIVGSTSSSNSGNTDILVFCIDENGNELWTQAYGSPQTEIGSDIAFTPSGDLMVLGYSNGIGDGGYDIYLLKINTSGDLIEEYSYGGNDWDFAYDMEINPMGGFYIVGETYSSGEGNNDGYLLAVDDDGNLLSEHTFGTMGEELFRSMTLDVDGNILAIGDQQLEDENKSSSWILKLSPSGNLLNEYTRHLYPDYDEHGEAIFATADRIIGLSSFPDNVDGSNKSARWAVDYSFEDLWTRESANFILQGIVPRSEQNFFGLGYDLSIDAFSMSFKTSSGWITDVLGTSTPTSLDVSFGPEKFYGGIKTSDNGYLFVGEADINNEGQLSVLVTKFDSLLVTLPEVEIAELPLSISEYNLGIELQVYPSPAKDVLLISHQINQGKLEYQISNSIGQLIQSDWYIESGIDVSYLPSGLYLLEVSLDSEFYGGTRFMVE